MKKKPAMLLTLSALAVVGMASCGNTNAPASSVNPPEPDVIDSASIVTTKKAVTVDDADGSAVVKIFTQAEEGLYEAGSNLAFSVEAKKHADITGVYFDGELIAEEAGSFTVVMPNTDVEIKITTRLYGDPDLLEVSDVDASVMPGVDEEHKNDFASVQAAYAKLQAALLKSAEVEPTYLQGVHVQGKDTPIVKAALGVGSTSDEVEWDATYGFNNQTYLDGQITTTSYNGTKSTKFYAAQRGYDSYGHYYEDSEELSKPGTGKSAVSFSNHKIAAKTVIADKTEDGEDAVAGTNQITHKAAEKAIHTSGVGEALIANFFTAGQTYNFVDVDKSTGEDGVEVQSYKAKIVEFKSELAADKKSYTTTLEAVVPSTYLVKRYTLKLTFDGDGLLTHVEQAFSNTPAKNFNADDLSFAEDAVFTELNSFSMDATRDYKKDIDFLDLADYAMKDYEVHFTTERITDGNTNVTLKDNVVYAGGRIEAMSFVSKDIENGHAGIISPSLVGFKEGYEDMGEVDVKNQYITLTETGKVVLLFDNLFGETKEVEIDVQTPKVFKVTGSISATTAYTNTPITIKAKGTPSAADNLKLALDLGDNATQAEVVKEAELDENGNTVFTVTPKEDGTLKGNVYAVGNPDAKYEFSVSVLAKPSYNKVLNNFTNYTLKYVGESSGYSGYTKTIWLNFEAPTDGVGTGTWQSEYEDSWGDTTNWHGTFRYTVTDNNDVPEFKLTNATAQSDGTYKDFSIYVNESYTLSSFTVTSNSTAEFKTDRDLIYGSETAQAFSLLDSRLTLNKGTAK